MLQRHVVTIVQTVIPRLTTSTIEIFNDGMLVKDYDNFNITPKSKWFMINASGGTGEAVLINSLISSLNIQKKTFIVGSSSVVAATLVIDGTTAHSTLKIPWLNCNTSKFIVPVESKQVQQLLETDFVISDEVVTNDKHCI